MTAATGLVVAPCVFGAVTGFNDGGNLLASFTAGRVLSPRAAWCVLLLAVLGPLAMGTAVARTVGASVVDLQGQGAGGFVAITAVSVAVILASWRARIPTSTTLALVGAMIGWALADAHARIGWAGVAKVVVGMPVSVLGGLVCAFALYRVTRRALASQPHARVLSLARYQYATSALQAVAYGGNGMEKTVGLFVVAQAIARPGTGLHFDGLLPLLLAFATFAVGALVGGWHIARRVGTAVFRARPMQAMSEQLGAGLVVAGLAFAGAPVSSTQTVCGALVGIGVGVRASAVRWGIVRQMVASWLVTLPLALAAGLVLHLVVRGAGLA